MKRPKDISAITIDEVKRSNCGCSQCLWASIECKDYEKFTPAWSEAFKQPTCKAYAYYD